MANKKFTDLTSASSLAGSDILAVTVDPSGTPATRSTTITQLMGQAPVQQSDITPLATQVSLGQTETDLTALINLRATQVSLGNHEALTQAHGISAFGASLVDDADAATARTTLDVDQAGTDNSTNVTLDTTNHDYLSLTGQTVSLGAIDLSTDVTGLLPNTSVSGLGSAATTASTDYATSAQGALANTATQPGDNISTLTNDSGFITGLSAGALSDFDFDDNAVFGFGASVSTPTITANAYTVTDADNGKVLALNNGATAMTVNINTGLVSGFNCSFIQTGSGQVTFAGTATVNNRQSHTKINDQYGVASIVAYATDTYILAGDTAS